MEVRRLYKLSSELISDPFTTAVTAGVETIIINPYHVLEQLAEKNKFNLKEFEQFCQKLTLFLQNKLESSCLIDLDWEIYERINYYYAEEFLQTLSNNDLILIDDLRCLCIAKHVRHYLPHVGISYTLKSFPPLSSFNTLAESFAKDLLSNFLCADHISFFSPLASQDFLKSALVYQGIEHHLNNINMNQHLTKIFIRPSHDDIYEEKTNIEDFLQTYFQRNKYLHFTDAHDLLLKYQCATNRLMILNFDHMLGAPKAYTDDIIPANLFTALNTLNSDKKNKIIIVSRHSTNLLESWFGDLNIPLWAIQEHSHCQPYPTNTYWQQYIISILKQFTAYLPNSLIEEKDDEIVWYYNCENHILHLAYELVDYLISLTTNLPLIILRKKMSVEIKSAFGGINYLIHKMIAKKNYNFIFAMSDDVIGEDLFSALPDNSFSIKVGSSIFGKYNVRSFKEGLELLQAFTQTQTSKESQELPIFS